MKRLEALKDENERRALNFIRAYTASEGQAPTLNQIAKRLGGLSITTVTKYLDALEADGKITRTKNVPRGIQIVEGKR